MGTSVLFKIASRLRFLIACLLLSLATGVWQSASAQTALFTDPDSAFNQARSLAFSGKRQEGRDLAIHISQQYPRYLDIKTFIGRTYAWDGLYAEARRAFAEVQSLDPKTQDNYLAWADAERWADEPANALLVVEKGLLYFTDDVELLYRKARILSITGKIAEAKLLTQKVLRRQPKHQAAYLLLQELRSQLLDNEVAVGYSYEDFSRYYTPAHFAFVQGSRTTPYGSIIARVNYANRFGTQATQPELELYPKISRGLYGYLNFGFSNGDLFPRQRYGAEIFAGLPLSLEASLGMRHLSFSETSKVTIYTGSVGYYVGNYWLSLRSYLTPTDQRNSVSTALTVRRYFRSPEHYFSMRIGAGFSPELVNLQSAAKQFYNLQSQSVNVDYQQPLSRRWAVSGNLTFGRQELLFAPGEYCNNIGSSLTIKYRYR